MPGSCQRPHTLRSRNASVLAKKMAEERAGGCEARSQRAGVHTGFYNISRTCSIAGNATFAVVCLPRTTLCYCGCSCRAASAQGSGTSNWSPPNCSIVLAETHPATPCGWCQRARAGRGLKRRERRQILRSCSALCHQQRSYIRASTIICEEICFLFLAMGGNGCLVWSDLWKFGVICGNLE